jgi:putative ATP-dependent endonuclease of the OLD family
MYISKARIRNFRCFRDEVIEFHDGLNVIIGENNAGKSGLLKALAYVVGHGRKRPDLHDFNRSDPPDLTSAPEIQITLTISSSPTDTLEDKAVVATWLTKLASPWEAELTYLFALEEKDANACKEQLSKRHDGQTEREYHDAILESFLPKFVSRVYGGDLSSRIVADPEYLGRFDYQFLDAIRDAEAQLTSGSNPLLKQMLRKVIDIGNEAEKTTELQRKFRQLAVDLGQNVKSRISTDTLLALVKKTGAEDGGSLQLMDRLREDDVLASLRLFIARNGINIPAELNGLGYNNLIYISLVLASLDFDSDRNRRGPNAVVFPVLVVEEPEAHLHPSLQHKLLKYIRERLDSPRKSRQVFLTSHSTHITAAAGLDNLICMFDAGASTPRAAYPGKCFGPDQLSQDAKKYVERYLDATKSNMLFARSVVFVEGLAEQLLVPVMSKYLEGCDFEDGHVCVVAVGGVTFKYFLPIFGIGTLAELTRFALPRRVSILLDSDPSRKSVEDQKARFKGCWPYALNNNNKEYEYQPLSPVARSIQSSCEGSDRVIVRLSTKTLEYDLAHCNYDSPIVVTSECVLADDLKNFAQKSVLSNKLKTVLNDIPELEQIEPQESRRAASFATAYLYCAEGAKGAHAFELAKALRENLDRKRECRLPFTVPKYIEDVIRWVRGARSETDPKAENTVA